MKRIEGKMAGYMFLDSQDEALYTHVQSFPHTVTSYLACSYKHVTICPAAEQRKLGSRVTLRWNSVSLSKS